jgi:hypothetical protein
MMQELTRLALVGTAQAGAAAAPDAAHPAERLVARMPAETEREHQFLLRAGVRAVYEQCGRQPSGSGSAIEACPPEERRVAPAALIGLLQNTLATQAWDLLNEYLQQFAERQWVWQPELLPQLLSTGDASVRERALPVLGERGRWLSRFHPDWHWVTAGSPALSGADRQTLVRLWDEGTIGERCRALETLRRTEPAEARQWLQESAAKEKADQRARLVATLSVGLNTDDEPFLESLLDDRSEQVRQVAAGLLARLPDSALSARMRSRAEVLLSAEKTGLLRKKLKLVCRPPEEIDKTWERDGISRKVPAGQGKRAIWTAAVVSAVPPGWWLERFSSDPAQLIAAIEQDDFSDAVLTGWTQAAVTFSQSSQSSAWLQALWHHWLGVESRTRGAKSARPVLGHLRDILTVLPEAERGFQPVLKSAAADADADLLTLLDLLPRPWSEPFAGDYLAAVRSVLRKHADQQAYHWANTLVVAGRAVPRASFAAALEPFALAAAESTNWHSGAVQREIDKFTECVQSRKTFYESLDG